MRLLLAPNAFTALIYSSFFTTSTCPLAILAYPGTLAIPMERITFSIPAPRAVISIKANNVKGNADIPSITRMIIISTFPPAYPEIKPARIPITAPTAIPPTATIKETRPPWINLASKSLPKLSAPNGRPGVPGFAFTFKKSIAAGSTLYINGPTKENKVTNTTRIKPNIADLFLRSFLHALFAFRSFNNISC